MFIYIAAYEFLFEKLAVLPMLLMICFCMIFLDAFIDCYTFSRTRCFLFLNFDRIITLKTYYTSSNLYLKVLVYRSQIN